MATNNLSSTIVFQLLRNKDNYANWCAWMKNYLLAQDLWDVVKEPRKLDKAWTKNNAAALHVILISCEADIVTPEIREITSAKTLWNKLASLYGPDNSSSIPNYSSSNISEILVVPSLESLEGVISMHNGLLREYREATNNGDPNALVDLRRIQENATRAGINSRRRTVLHLAVFAEELQSVEKLVRLMSKEELAIQDENGLTALALGAAILTNSASPVVDWMLKKNPNLVYIKDRWNRTPLITALEYGNIKMAHCLHYNASQPNPALTDFVCSTVDCSTVLTLSILRNDFDTALHLLHYCPLSASVKNKYGTYPLGALASKSSVFRGRSQLVFWKKCIYACMCINPILLPTDDYLLRKIHNESVQVESSTSVLGRLRGLASNLLNLLGISQIYEMKLLHHQAVELLRKICEDVKKMDVNHVNGAIILAIKGGIFEFIDKILQKDRQLLYTTDTMGRNILFYAVLHRQDKIFRKILKLDGKKLITNALDKSGSTILHMAGMLEPSTERDRITGGALRMQTELKWFKEVESICLPWIKEIRNDTNMTARELFTHNHKDMMKEGEIWMKGTATSCTVVGALIVTIMFTAAFAVPGGNDQNTGFPMFSHKTLFTVFIMFDALSLFSSSTSILAFLGILTSRYAQEDFLQSLPFKMLLGYYTLFSSIASMIITFCAGLFIMLPEKSWMIFPVICLAIGTVIQFAIMQFTLLDGMYRSIVLYTWRKLVTKWNVNSSYLL